jgi:hypothetical protein
MAGGVASGTQRARHPAGGARAKAVIAWNPKTEEIRAGQLAAPPGFEHWLLKCDGMGKDNDLGLPRLRADRVRLPPYGTGCRHHDGR